MASARRSPATPLRSWRFYHDLATSMAFARRLHGDPTTTPRRPHCGYKTLVFFWNDAGSSCLNSDMRRLKWPNCPLLTSPSHGLTQHLFRLALLLLRRLRVIIRAVISFACCCWRSICCSTSKFSAMMTYSLDVERYTDEDAKTPGFIADRP